MQVLQGYFQSDSGEKQSTFLYTDSTYFKFLNNDGGKSSIEAQYVTWDDLFDPKREILR